MSTTFRSIPTLDELAADPGRITGLSVEAARALLARCALAQGLLVARLLEGITDAAHRPGETREDRLLSVPEAAARLNVSVDYVYRHHFEWPFTVRRGRKLGFSEWGLTAYLQRRQKSGP